MRLRLARRLPEPTSTLDVTETLHHTSPEYLWRRQRAIERGLACSGRPESLPIPTCSMASSNQGEWHFHLQRLAMVHLPGRAKRPFFSPQSPSIGIRFPAWLFGCQSHQRLEGHETVLVPDGGSSSETSVEKYVIRGHGNMKRCVVYTASTRYVLPFICDV